MSDAKHSPVPWRVELLGHAALRIVDAAGDDVVVVRHEAYIEPMKETGAVLERICRAVNSHAALVAACEAALELLAIQLPDSLSDMKKIRAAIATAKGGAA